jgi:electron transport complex protein RnfC
VQEENKGMPKSMRGGLWFELHKKPAVDRPVDVLPAPAKLCIPVNEHRGAPSLPVVKAGDSVFLGQPLAVAGEGDSLGLHSPVSGRVLVIKDYDGPEGGKAITIENNGKDTVFIHNSQKKVHIDDLRPETIIALVKEAGIATATFCEPLWSKLRLMAENKVETLVINAVETEPYICTSQKLIAESPDLVAAGFAYLFKGVKAKKAVLAVSDDVHDAIVEDMVQSAHLNGIELKVEHVNLKYPSGYERYLAERILGEKIERSDRPEDHGLGLTYPEECVHVYNALTEETPLFFPQITRFITVAGGAVESPRVLEVRIGTPINYILDHCGLSFDPERVVLGSVMRGIAISDLNIPVTKYVTAVLALTSKSHGRITTICINCGRCVKVCPEGLLPNYLMQQAVKANIEACDKLHVDDCIGCGLCSYICPGKVPITELLKNIKKIKTLAVE